MVCPYRGQAKYTDHPRVFKIEQHARKADINRTCDLATKLLPNT